MAVASSEMLEELSSTFPNFRGYFLLGEANDFFRRGAAAKGRSLSASGGGAAAKGGAGGEAGTKGARQEQDIR